MADVRRVEAATKALRSQKQQHGPAFYRDAVAAQALLAETLKADVTNDRVRIRLERVVLELDDLANSYTLAHTEDEAEAEDWVRFFQEEGIT